MGKEPMKGLLLGAGGGDVAVDESYIGGKPRKFTGRHLAGRGTKKIPVVALVERGGRARAQVVADVTAPTLKKAIRENVDKSARIMTDQLRSYRGIGKEFAGGHVAVDHSAGEYSRDGLGTNEAEAFFALLKRGITGRFITSVSSICRNMLMNFPTVGTAERCLTASELPTPSAPARASGSCSRSLWRRKGRDIGNYEPKLA